jgi:hemerythrin
MAHFTWTAEHDVFLEPVDIEHRELFQLADELRSALSRGFEPGRVLEALNRLTAHINSRFSHEESLMRAVGYPSFSWHKSQHNTAQRRVKLFVPMIKSGDEAAAELFFEFLEGWLRDHTLVTDKMLASFVRNYQRTHPATSVFHDWSKPAPAAKRNDQPVPATQREQTVHRRATNRKQH